MFFDDIVVNCTMDKQFLNKVLANPSEYNLSDKEYNLLKETNFDMIGFQLDERNALSALAMWGSAI